MAFFSKLKRLFGFGPSADDELLQDTADCQDGPANGEGTEAADTSVTTEPSASDQPDEEPELDQDIRSKIFEHVVDVFNGAMPQFIRDSVDPNAQTEYIYRTLDDSVKEYFDTMDQRMQRKAERAYTERNAKLNNELDRLRRQSQVLEDERTTLRERQLSADRQRRALTDRVKDLEQKVAALDADREQLQLENRSLLNKLRLQSVDHPTPPSTEASTANNSTPASTTSGSPDSGGSSSGGGSSSSSGSGSSSSGGGSSSSSSGGSSSSGNNTVSGADSPRLPADVPAEVPADRTVADALAAQQAAEQAAAAATERAVKLSAKLDKVTEERNTARTALKQLEAEHTELQSTLQPLTVDNAKLHEAMKKQADMHRISEAMMGDLRRSAALTREELNNERRRAADLEAQLEATADLRQQLQQARERAQELDDIHAQAASLREALDQERNRVADLERQVQAGDQTEALTARCKQLESDLTKTRRRLTQAEALLAEVAEATEPQPPYTTTGTDSTVSGADGSRLPTTGTDSTVSGADSPRLPATGAPHISEAALQAMEANFSDENWRTEHLLTDPDPTPQSPPKRRGRPSKRSNNDDNPQLSLF